MKKEIIIFLITVFVSILAFAYMQNEAQHESFITKDTFMIICEKLNKIEDKLDRIIERNMK